MQNLNNWWFGSGGYGETMSSFFFSFAIGIGVVFLIISWVYYVNKQFSYFGGMVRLFWLVYLLEVVAILALWRNDFVGDYTSILWIPVLMTLHFIAVFLMHDG